MIISSRTPEGEPGHCPICGADPKVEPSDPPGDAPCPRCGHLIWFTANRTDDVTVIHLTSRIIGEETIRRIADSLADRPTIRLVFDFDGVQSLTSAALGALVELKRRFRDRRGGLIVRGLRPDLREIFRITRLDQVFQVEA